MTHRITYRSSFRVCSKVNSLKDSNRKQTDKNKTACINNSAKPNTILIIAEYRAEFTLYIGPSNVNPILRKSSLRKTCFPNGKPI